MVPAQSIELVNTQPVENALPAEPSSANYVPYKGEPDNIRSELIRIFRDRNPSDKLSIPEITKMIIDRRNSIFGRTGVQCLIVTVFGMNAEQFEDALKKELVLLMSEGKLVDAVRSEIVYSTQCPKVGCPFISP